MTIESIEKTAFKLISTWLDYRCRYEHQGGIQLTVRRDGEVVHSSAHGLADVSAGEKYTPRHLGRFASHTKMFTACMVLQLQQSGDLSLTDRLIDHLPQFRHHKSKRFKQITIEHLLANQSGIIRDVPDSRFWEQLIRYPNWDEIEQALLNSPVYVKPGSGQLKYSNTGYVVLGKVLEAITNKPYAILQKEMVLDKLPRGLQFYADYPQEASAHNKMAKGYSRALFDGGRCAFAPVSVSACISAYGICSNTLSMSGFVHHYLNTDLFLGASIRRKLKSAGVKAEGASDRYYSLGLQWRQCKSSMYIGHGGGFNGFMSLTQAIKGSPYVVSIISNATDAALVGIMSGVEQAMDQIAKLFPEAERPYLTVSPAMLSDWGGHIAVVGRKRAICFWLGGSDLVGGATTLTRGKDGLFYRDKADSFSSSHEPVRFHLKRGKLWATQFAGSYSYCEQAYHQLPTAGRFLSR